MSDQASLTTLQDATLRIREATEALERRRLLRQANLEPQRPGEAALKALDSSMKRNTALLRKLRQLSEEGRDQLLAELLKVNQSKYVSEAVAAVTEAPLKIKDVGAAVAVCSTLHQRYAEFGGELVAALGRLCGSAEEGLSRKRSALRLAVELLLCGLYTAHSALLQLVRQLAAGADFQRDAEAAQASLALLGGVAKAGREELLGLPPRLPTAVPPDAVPQGEEGVAPELAAAAEEYQAAVAGYEGELAQRFALPPEVQQQFRAAMQRCFRGAGQELVAAHEALVERERENTRVVTTRGDLPEEMAASYEQQRKAFESLQRNTAALAEALDEPLPELEDAAVRLTAPAEAAAASGAGEDQPQQVFEDEETRAFYESLPDLRALVPAVLLGDKEAGEGEGGEEPLGEAPSDKPTAAPDVTAAAATAAAGGLKPSGSTASLGGKKGAAEGKGGKAAGSSSKAAAGEVGQAAAQWGCPSCTYMNPAARSTCEMCNTQRPKLPGTYEGLLEGKVPEEPKKEPSALDLFIRRLPEAVSKEICDELAVAFCYLQGRGARRRLVRALTGEVPQGALALLPFYSRIAATLNQVFPDVGQGMVAALEAEFTVLQRSKDATIRTLEPRIRNARYVGELCKFSLFPHGSAFSMLKGLLDDFSGHNIDAACALVETAGRFFSRLPETGARMSNFLEVMMKLRNARNLDVRQSGLVDSAYFAVKAADKVVKRKKLPPMQAYVHYLIYQRLPLGEVSKVLKRLRKLPWGSEDWVEPFLLETCLEACWQGRFSVIPLIASLASGLRRYQPSFGVYLVDDVLEAVLLGLESPDAGMYQQRVAMMRLLGEFYNYKMVNSKVIFSTLYLLLSFGYEPSTPPEMTRRLDPPSNYFRLRLVCTLLEACGQYFTRGAARRQLDRLLPYIQRYTLAKPPLPLDVDYDLQELWAHLNLSPPAYASYEEAAAAVAEAEAQEAAAGGGAGDEDEESDEDGGAGSEDGGSEGGGSRGAEGDGESGSEEGEDDEGGGGLDTSDEEDAVRVLRPAPVEVDEDFEREFAALMLDSQGQRAGGPSGLGQQQHQQAGSSIGGAGPGGPVNSAGSGGGAGGSMAFRVLMKRGGRQDTTRELQIPVSAGMATQLRQKEEHEAAERAELKRLVLEASKRDAEEQQPAAQRRYARGASGYYGRGGGGRGLLH